MSYLVHVFIWALLRSGSCMDTKETENHNMELGACQACKTLVKSFLKGMTATARGKHEGGDADWESKKLKDYSMSEVRLAEIHSMLCNDVTRGKNQCHHLASEVEELMETDWWPLSTRPDLQRWLCVQRLQVCCEQHQFGPRCADCPGGQPPCSGRGRCKGAGTRKGSGQCVCDDGYAGAVCDTCNQTRHFESALDADGVVCTACHETCDAACTGAGPKLCVRCAAGYTRQAEEGCTDTDECRTEQSPCPVNKFCVNNVGSYSCLDCDKSCSSCHGDGPDMCIDCAEHFTKQDKTCVDGRLMKRERHATVARYLTYVGLLVACCILMQKSFALAALVAAAVSAYISMAEYQLYGDDRVTP